MVESNDAQCLEMQYAPGINTVSTGMHKVRELALICQYPITFKLYYATEMAGYISA